MSAPTRTPTQMVRPAASCALLLCALCATSCGSHERNTYERPEDVTEASDAPELLVPHDLASRPDTALLHNTRNRFDTDDESQPDTLPALPFGVTLDDVRRGDRLFHSKAGCLNCHGSEEQGLPARGSSLTFGLHTVPNSDVRGIDSIIVSGVADAETRSPIAMPPRGQKSNLTVAETHALASYVWAIANTRGEPWPGGHAQHEQRGVNASARTSIP